MIVGPEISSHGNAGCAPEWIVDIVTLTIDGPERIVRITTWTDAAVAASIVNHLQVMSFLHIVQHN